MSYLNVKKFLDCFVRYRRDCGGGRSMWIKNELHKFYFSNLLSRRIQIKFQSVEMILEICERIEEKNFYYKTRQTKIVGLQYLKGTGNAEFTEPITRNEIELLKHLVAKRDWCEADFASKNMSYPALSLWLGTLLPDRFVPVPSTHFRHPIAHLFDLNPDGFPEDGYEFFAHSQKYFQIVKERLLEFNLDSLYLKEIAEYVRFKYPKSTPKTAYSQYDWNWITEDFFLYVFREIMNLDTAAIPLETKKAEQQLSNKSPERQKAFDLYVP